MGLTSAWYAFYTLGSNVIKELADQGYTTYRALLVHGKAEPGPGVEEDDQVIYDWTVSKDAVIVYVEIGVEAYAPNGNLPAGGSFVCGAVWHGNCNLLTSSAILGAQGGAGGLSLKTADIYPNLRVPIPAGVHVVSKMSYKNTHSTAKMWVDGWMRIHFAEKP